MLFSLSPSHSSFAIKAGTVSVVFFEEFEMTFATENSRGLRR